MDAGTAGDELVRLTEHDNISRDTVRRRWAENRIQDRRARACGASREVMASSSTRMDVVLRPVCAERDRERPVVCCDESPTRLIGEVRQAIRAKPGQLERYDCEYKRDGTANRFIFRDVHRPGARSKSPTAAPPSTSRPACGNSRTFTFPRRSASASCWTICRRTRSASCTRPSRLPKPTACCTARRSTTSPSAPAG